MPLLQKRAPRSLIESLFVLLLASASASAQTTLTINATVRDFIDGVTTVPGYTAHPDFQNILGDDRNMVSTTLGGDGKPVYLGAPTTPTTHGAALFNMWYNNTPGYNQTTTIPLTLTETGAGTGVFQYINANYFPIDNALLGNQGRGHNFGFTTEIHTLFTYRVGQSFAFSNADDDVWMFINNKRVIDLGGVHGAQSASVNLDTLAATLGIVDGQTYTLDIFQAERHTTQSNFSFSTTISSLTPNPAFSAAPEPGTLVLAGLGLIAVPMIRRRWQISAA
jgi:fibro-slime domain-containing protein